jgi:P-type Cu+ transporter
MKKKFNVKGMHCKACEMLIKEGLSEIGGVKSVDISLIRNTVDVDYDEKKIKDAQIIKAIEKEGYKVV